MSVQRWSPDEDEWRVDFYHDDDGQWVAYPDHAAALAAEREKAVRDCADYMEHQPPCPLWDEPGPGAVCSCGLAALLDRAEPTEGE